MQIENEKKLRKPENVNALRRLNIRQCDSRKINVNNEHGIYVSPNPFPNYEFKNSNDVTPTTNYFSEERRQHSQYEFNNSNTSFRIYTPPEVIFFMYETSLNTRPVPSTTAVSGSSER